jgi:hypothetical protein
LVNRTAHVFICFSSKDAAIARDVVEFLEAEGLKCWISLRDVPPGQNYQETIVAALEAAQGIVFLFSEDSSRSEETKKELSIGASVNVPVFPLRLAPIVPSGALRYELATRQWVDLFPDRRAALAKLANTIKTVVSAPAVAQGAEPELAAAERAPAAIRPAPQPPRPPIVAPGTPQFETVRGLLARHIGPIARIFVEQAAKEAKDPAEFCDRLAAHVNTPAARAAFLQALRAELADKS